MSKRKMPPKMHFRTLRRLLCAYRGHRVYEGQNGWQNFGTGWFCRTCETMTLPPYFCAPYATKVPHPPVYGD